MPTASTASSPAAAAAAPAPSSDAEHVAGVLVVGGGYAGLHAARAVERSGHPVTILDQRDDHDFVTRLAGVAAGAAPVDDASRPLRSFHSAIESGTLATVADGAITLDDGRVLTADAIVISAGARPTRPPVKGIEYALPLRTADDALAIRTALAATSSMIVIGGGATGVQLAASVAHQRPEIDVHVVDGAPRLLVPMRASTADGARRILEDRGAELHLGSFVDRIRPDGIDLDGRSIDGLVVWAGGFEARGDELGVDVSHDGRILVDDHLRIVGMRRTFAAGDIAAHLGADGDALPMSAQIAVQAGTAAGRNAARVIDGSELDEPSLAQRGWVLDLGGHRGLAEFGSISLAAPWVDLLPPLLHELIDLKTLYGIGGLSALRW